MTHKVLWAALVAAIVIPLSPITVDAQAGLGKRVETSYPSLAVKHGRIPPACAIALQSLDSNEDGVVDEGLPRGRQPDMRPAEACIIEGDRPWGHYLKAMILAVHGKNAEAAAAAGEALRSLPKQCPPNCPWPPAEKQVGPNGYPPPDVFLLRLFRANLLAEAGKWAEAVAIYDELLREKPGDLLITALKANRSWPPPGGWPPPTRPR